jgi:hypothetical protein
MASSGSSAKISQKLGDDALRLLLMCATLWGIFIRVRMRFLHPPDRL